ncbi:hypothetical protein BDQ12DRAFT_587558, partial [Crucibulum laeve]
LVGYLLNWGLYGVLSVQVCIYYAAFPDDKTGTKSLVYGTYILETIQTVLVTHDAFHALVIGFGNLDCLTRTNFTWLTAGVMAGLIACIVQIFYAYRIYVFSKSKIMAAFITLMALTQCSAGIVAGSLAAVVSNWTMLTFKSVRIASGIWTAVSAACDVVIAICMSYQASIFLSRRKSILKSTQTLLTRIIKLVIGTGIFTALVAILSLVLFEATHLRGALFSTPGLILAKFYSNSMMVILNSR